jgi:hypothetical protein
MMPQEPITGLEPILSDMRPENQAPLLAMNTKVDDTNSSTVETRSTHTAESSVSLPEQEDQHTDEPQPSVSTNSNVKKTKNSRPGRAGSFPQKLHQMINELAKQGQQDIASFVLDGKAFLIHRPKEFAEAVMPKYFKMVCFPLILLQYCIYSIYLLYFFPFMTLPCRFL